MIIGKSKKEIEKMRAAGQLAGQVLATLRTMVQPGVPTIEIDIAAEKMIRDAGALPTFKGYNGFPYSICASVNEQVVHGFPSSYKLREGDIFSIDCGATLEGFVGDTATTVPVGIIDERVDLLLRVTEKALERAIHIAREGTRLGDICAEIDDEARRNRFSVVREFVGHGVGRKLHEEPQIPNYGKRGSGPRLKAGMTLAIEPMINMGTAAVRLLEDGWTVRTADGLPSAHFEHTVLITKGDPEILTWRGKTQLK